MKRHQTGTVLRASFEAAALRAGVALLFAAILPKLTNTQQK